MPKVTKNLLVRRQMTACPVKQRRGQHLPRCFDCVRNGDECRFQSAFTPWLIGYHHSLMLHLTEKRMYNDMGSVEFDFKGSSGPPTYRQRMNQRDSLGSIRAKMVSPLPC